MKPLLIALFGVASASPAIGGDATAFQSQPSVLSKVIDSLNEAKIDHLTPKIYEDDGRSYSYYVQSATWLGTLVRGEEEFLLATATFMRSKAKGGEQAMARSHGFLLCLSKDFKLLHHCRLDPGAVLDGDKLVREGKVIADFSADDEATRTRGYLIDGSDFLPYPFSNEER
ncbi:hypothetical protein OJ996_06110 [Luteolibacter sp. GHJ8]|uniref:Uncharacterized protein n=1 Tax=Luteolibacter rhizosphaerae TaxID=2989719 RepID=A0ABT3FZX7_9BACT|nr:hypothetical protein [Luteolibacter rhizosphaerae]MCW1913136.1 hypothetical protein [Luteolibacter rhizosphaerae]